MWDDVDGCAYTYLMAPESVDEWNEAQLRMRTSTPPPDHPSALFLQSRDPYWNPPPPPSDQQQFGNCTNSPHTPPNQFGFATPHQQTPPHDAPEYPVPMQMLSFNYSFSNYNGCTPVQQMGMCTGSPPLPRQIEFVTPHRQTPPLTVNAPINMADLNCTTPNCSGCRSQTVLQQVVRGTPPYPTAQSGFATPNQQRPSLDRPSPDATFAQLTPVCIDQQLVKCTDSSRTPPNHYEFVTSHEFTPPLDRHPDLMPLDDAHFATPSLPVRIQQQMGIRTDSPHTPTYPTTPVGFTTPQKSKTPVSCSSPDHSSTLSSGSGFRSRTVGSSSPDVRPLQQLSPMEEKKKRRKRESSKDPPQSRKRGRLPALKQWDGRILPNPKLNRRNNAGLKVLWFFILEMLVDETKKDVIVWTGKKLEFKIVDIETFRQLWGDHNHHRNVKFDSIERSLRSYFHRIILPVNKGSHKGHNVRGLYQFITEPAVHVNWSEATLDEYIKRHSDPSHASTDDEKAFSIRKPRAVMEAEDYSNAGRMLPHRKRRTMMDPTVDSSPPSTKQDASTSPPPQSFLEWCSSPPSDLVIPHCFPRVISPPKYDFL